MNKTIYKFPIEVIDDSQITLPKNAEILCVQMQDGNPYIWVMIDKGEKKAEVRHFCLFGTGHPFALLDYKYIGSFQMYAGSLVFHLFETNI